MTQNPFEGMGGEGGFDMGALLQQAQAMQEQLMETQKRLAEAVVTGSVAGGAVNVTVSGTGDLVGVDLKEGVLEGTDADSLAELGDLVVAAYRDAKAQADRNAQDTLGPLAGGMPGMPGTDGLPGGRTPGSGGFGF
ncbi:YbaB/EbfC family nucleoid-associated protein [Nocardioides bruguierae]|uniref:Nucleoid-associated protein M8330_10310 n=1 Tax=Nocardioides bruguierae TaxID=2945102 RepID=A0A9X2D789_9ACTN|nr:YbaB/EbfC family nucleoid-associated protein [Nocardioides bruguierae]MCM0620683.1 YbaB/EbfC family nucleoid-associated protein [Nocardioides bruguierae]